MVAGKYFLWVADTSLLHVVVLFLGFERTIKCEKWLYFFYFCGTIFVNIVCY